MGSVYEGASRGPKPEKNEKGLLDQEGKHHNHFEKTAVKMKGGMTWERSCWEKGGGPFRLTLLGRGRERMWVQP